MSKEELIRKLESTPVMIEGGRLFVRKAVLIIVAFFITTVIMSFVHFFTYFEMSPNLLNKENKEQAAYDFISNNLNASDLPALMDVLVIIGVFVLVYLALTLVIGPVKGILIHKCAIAYEEQLDVPEEEKVTVDSIISRLPLIIAVQGLYLAITGFLPLFLMMLLTYVHNFLDKNVSFIRLNEDISVLVQLVFFVLLLFTMVGMIILLARYALAMFIASTNKNAGILSSFSIAKRYVQDDQEVIYGFVGIFIFIKFFLNAYPLFMLYNMWANLGGVYTPSESLNSVLLLFLIFAPLTAIISGFELTVFTVAGVFLHRRNVSYKEMQEKVVVAVEDYEEKKSQTLDTSKMAWRQQKVGEMTVSDAVEKEERKFLVCEYCGEKFFRQVNYDLHLSRDHADKTGEDTSEITCEYCGKKIIGKSAYDAHMKIFHSAKLKDKEEE